MFTEYFDTLDKLDTDHDYRQDCNEINRAEKAVKLLKGGELSKEDVVRLVELGCTYDFLEKEWCVP